MSIHAFSPDDPSDPPTKLATIVRGLGSLVALIILILISAAVTGFLVKLGLRLFQFGWGVIL